jgi:hypothetical protein
MNQQTGKSTIYNDVILYLKISLEMVGSLEFSNSKEFTRKIFEKWKHSACFFYINNAELCAWIFTRRIYIFWKITENEEVEVELIDFDAAVFIGEPLSEELSLRLKANDHYRNKLVTIYLSR